MFIIKTVNYYFKHYYPIRKQLFKLFGKIKLNGSTLTTDKQKADAFANRLEKKYFATKIRHQNQNKSRRPHEI